MRPIKFRAWHKETKKMIDLQRITPLALSDSMNTQLSLQGMSGLFIPFRKDMPLMQYTGLKDKNGKEIYEGDIVRATSPMVMLMSGKQTGKKSIEDYYIIYVESEARFAIQKKDKKQHQVFHLKQGIITSYYEVIGNIYMNKELLK